MLAELIAEIWQRCNVAKQKSDWAGNASGSRVRQVVNKPAGWSDLWDRRQEEEKTKNRQIVGFTEGLLAINLDKLNRSDQLIPRVSESKLVADLHL